MKVEGPNKSSKSSGTKKKGNVSKGDTTFGDMVTGGAKEASGVSPTQSVARVDALLAVQATESPTERSARKRMTQRANMLLDELEGIKMGLLSGTLTVGHIVDVADVVASHREKINDPNLTSLLDEIDLRAQVELAKLKKAMDN